MSGDKQPEQFREILISKFREENELLRKELHEIKSRRADDIKSNVSFLCNFLNYKIQCLQHCREESIARNFGIMNSFFMSLNDDVEPDDSIFQHQDTWPDETSDNFSKVIDCYMKFVVAIMHFFRANLQMFLQATIKLSNNEKKVVTIYLTLMKKNFTKIFSKDFLVQRVLEQYQRVPGS